jgi:heme A synthase
METGTGSLPPLFAEDWNSEFSKYRASPEFKLLNPHMTLEEFKKIYYMEWGHRLWGCSSGYPSFSRLSTTFLNGKS